MRLLHTVMAAALLFGAAGACGRKTFIRPPELAAPARIDDLSASNVADGIQLGWRRPRTYADGTRMGDLGAFRVERSAAPGAPFEVVATIEITDRDRFRQERRFRWLDRNVMTGESYLYRVVSETSDGYMSEPSNIAGIERVEP